MNEHILKQEKNKKWGVDWWTTVGCNSNETAYKPWRQGRIHVNNIIEYEYKYKYKITLNIIITIDRFWLTIWISRLNNADS